jgi:hypothetical protein
VLAGALLTAISPLMAQSGRVRIRVTDATGGKIPGAEASLLGNGDKLTVGRADAAGEIVLTGLPIGESRITLSHPGFKSLPLVVTIGNSDELNVDAKMEVGPFTMGVIVEAQLPPPSTEPPAENLNSIIPQHEVAVPPPPVELSVQASQPKRKRKRWWNSR